MAVVHAKKVYGYLRVSTTKQGEGVSLIVQKEAISRYAEQYNLEIIEWFEEKVTAAKAGRPLFNKMMSLLKGRKASGVIIHKIDRGSRNLKDWADLGNLIDSGIEVHFAHESLDLQARGGRLSADIQAVIAADYIRNLRQEALKGIYGRLKQGIYPFQAPTGYTDMGRGNVKAVSEQQAPLVREAFELYATRKYTLETLCIEMYKRGLRNIRGKRVNINSLSAILNNPFYTGIIKVKGQTFNGAHHPIVSTKLYSEVQRILRGNDNQKVLKHDFAFRRMLKCKTCQFTLIGELQKGHVYYRCHTKTCSTKGIRESMVQRMLNKTLSAVELTQDEIAGLNKEMAETEKGWIQKHKEILNSIAMQKSQISTRLERLTDCYVEGGLDKQTFEHRKHALLIELKNTEECERNQIEDQTGILKRINNFLELAKSLIQTYENAILEEKKDLLKIVTSNLEIEGKKLIVSMKSPFQELINRSIFTSGVPQPTTPRKTLRNLAPPPPVLTIAPEDVEVHCVREPLSAEALKEFFQLLLVVFNRSDPE